MMIIQLCKVAFVAAMAFFFTLVAFGNLTHYDSNWQFVKHVLSMDTIFPNSVLRWRAINSPTVQQIGYWGIIAAETVTAIILWLGSFRLLQVVGTRAFGRTNDLAVLGLTLGLLLYAVGFIAIGGEWFAMWQSQTWNGQQKAFNFIAMIGAVMVILLLPEDDAMA